MKEYLGFPFTSNNKIEGNKLDHKREQYDLAWDVVQKRKLNRRLLKKVKVLKIAFLVNSSLLSVFIVALFLIVFGKGYSAKKTFNQHYDYYKDRYISMYSIGEMNAEELDDVMQLIHEYKIIVQPQMLIALSAIEKGDFNYALQKLTKIDDPQARWLEALCLLRNGENEKAKDAFNHIIESQSVFSEASEDIIKKHYSE